MKKGIIFFVLLLYCAACHSPIHRNFSEGKKDQDIKPDLNYDPRSKDPHLDTFFVHLHNRKGFNGVVLIAKKGKIIYENCFGFANYLKKDSLKIDSRFQLASISKQFTAMAILILRDQGKVKLNQLVTDFFPNFPYPHISLKLLLTHRSGLFKYEYFSEKVWKDKHKPMSNLDLMNLISQYKPGLFSQPNTHFYYNNINYAILAAIVEKVSGQSLGQFIKSHVFIPLGMKNTSIYSMASDSVFPTNLMGYEKSFRRRGASNWLDGVVGDKGVYSTVQDLFIWDQYLYTNKLLSQTSLNEGFISQSRLEKGHFGYGYGWRIFYLSDPGTDSLKRESGGKIVYHTGWWHGFHNIFLRDLKNRNTIIILSNVFNSSIKDLDPLYKLMKMPIIRHNAYENEQ